ncbi:hypothetical protein [Thioflavicoccus mobilis]|uniref:hypothetical protein n=1 Tax=Thioflavicoccus mobilis TaxID=80679 RepID=UPI0002F9298B|nr:hypothetical protein [Thioflavicoccus mobilis]
MPLAQRRWYIEQAETFAAAVRPKRLVEVSAAEITAFFPRYPREQQLDDWQFRQMVNALQLLLQEGKARRRRKARV